MDKTRVKAELTIEGDGLNPQHVTNELKIVPSKSWEKGDIFKESKKRVCGSWSLLVEYEESYDIADQLEKLFTLINGKEKLIRGIKELYSGSIIISIVIEVENGEVPGIVINEDTSKLLVTLGAEIDIDIYIMS